MPGSSLPRPVPEVRLVLRPGLLVRLRHVDGLQPARLPRLVRVALPLTGLAEHAELAVEDVDVEVGDAHVRVAVAGDELHRLQGAGARDPHLRMRLLDRTGPGVHEPQLVVPADELDRPGLRPGLDDDVVGLVEPFAGVGRVDREAVVLRPATDDEPGDEPATGDVVDHGELLRHPRRRVVQRERVADDADLHPRRLAGEDGAHQVGRGHEPVGVLMVLVDADTVEAELVGVDELVEVPVVDLVTDLRVVQGVGDRDPGGTVVVVRKSRVGHEVEREHTHRGPPVVMACAARATVVAWRPRWPGAGPPLAPRGGAGPVPSRRRPRP